MSLRWTALQLVIVSVLVIASAPFARATVIPDASYEIAVTINPNITSENPANGIGSLTESYCDSGSGGGCQSATSSVDGTQASIMGSQSCKVGFSPCNNATPSSASVNIALFYEVINLANPSDTSMVALLFTGNLTTGVSGSNGNATASAAIVVDGTGIQIQGCTTVAVTSCNSLGSDASLTNAPFSVPLDSVQRIDLTLSGSALATDPSGVGYTGTLDPLVQIDPNFLAANPNLSLEFSANLPADLTAVPEPSSFVLLGAGLFGLGFMVRKRKAS
jgi:hypothetical protein